MDGRTTPHGECHHHSALHRGMRMRGRTGKGDLCLLPACLPAWRRRRRLCRPRPLNVRCPSVLSDPTTVRPPSVAAIDEALFPSGKWTSKLDGDGSGGGSGGGGGVGGLGGEMNGRSITHSSQAAIKQAASRPRPPSLPGRGCGGSSSICICVSHLDELSRRSARRRGTITINYRVRMVVCHTGWVDIDLGHSTSCQVQIGIGLNWLGSWAKWWNI